jgi:hypothetical protein
MHGFTKTINVRNKALADPGDDQRREAEQLNIPQRTIDKRSAHDQAMLGMRCSLGKEEHGLQDRAQQEP